MVRAERIVLVLQENASDRILGRISEKTSKVRKHPRSLIVIPTAVGLNIRRIKIGPMENLKVRIGTPENLTPRQLKRCPCLGGSNQSHDSVELPCRCPAPIGVAFH